MVSNGAVGMARGYKKMVELVEEAGEAAEENMYDISSAGSKQVDGKLKCTPPRTLVSTPVSTNC